MTEPLPTVAENILERYGYAIRPDEKWTIINGWLFIKRPFNKYILVYEDGSFEELELRAC